MTLRKQGNICTLDIYNIILKNSATSAVQIGTINSALVPPANTGVLTLHTVGGGSFPCAVTVRTDGKIFASGLDWNGSFKSTILYLSANLSWTK